MTDEIKHEDELNVLEDTRVEDEDKFFCRFTFGQFFALLIFQAITLFFIFYLGARYGRDLLGMNDSISVQSTADPEVRQIADELIEKAKPQAQIQVQQPEQTRQPQELKEKLADVLRESRIADEPPKIRVEERPEVSAQTAIQEQGQDPTMVQGAVRIVSPEKSKFSIQIGSYQKMSEATDRVDDWKQRGYPAYMMIADIPDRGRWYRVRIGSYATEAEAEEYKRQVKSKENVDAMVVMNER